MNKMWKIKKKYVNGAIMYSKRFDGMEVTVLIAKMTNGRWNVEPSTMLFPERNFRTKEQALTYARTQMKKN